MAIDKYLPNVRRQYEDYPYPPCNPLDEKKRLVSLGMDCLDLVNHYCHSGDKDFSLGVRILVAGGGTGDEIIFLAEQLRNTDSELIYLDFSNASMGIAQERARIRGLKNIAWIHDSLLNIPSLCLGKFDHICCSGVLHHLEDPVAGLRALASVLDDNGAMSIMVYAQYGRTAVYQMQELMGLINQNEDDMASEIHNCRLVRDALPTDHWYRLANTSTEYVGDIELYDRYLHSQDRAYTVTQLYDYVSTADMKLLQLFNFENGGNNIYKPGFYIKDKKLLSSITKLNFIQQQAIAELLNGRMLMHSFYLSRKAVLAPNSSSLDYIPAISMMITNDYSGLSKLVCSSKGMVQINLPARNLELVFKITPHTVEFFKHMDGERTIKVIYDNIISLGGDDGERPNYESLAEEFSNLFSVLISNNFLHMRHHSIPASKPVDRLHNQQYSDTPRS